MLYHYQACFLVLKSLSWLKVTWDQRISQHALEVEGVHSVDKANITGLSHMHTLAVLNSLVFTLLDKIKAAAQFADMTESVRSLCSSIDRVEECKHVFFQIQTTF